MRLLFEAYGKAQARRPYATQIGTSIAIWLCGDLSAQLLLPPEPVKHESWSKRLEAQKYDPWRTARHLTVGIVASIPSYKWQVANYPFKLSSNALTASYRFMFLHGQFNFASTAASLATKVLVQQAIYTPIFNTYFFAAQSLLSGASVEDMVMRLQLVLPMSIVNGWKVWSVVALISFMYVPAQFRGAFSGCVAV
ncbi:hypothetical protein G3M48_006910 [Beauveria asiatica]|uniref:Uncharacterized protein n=1 Tax=Beauveria asiatica TaxID=1069075 RepID=A0AAW0S4T5_9HYPO